MFKLTNVFFKNFLNYQNEYKTKTLNNTKTIHMQFLFIPCRTLSNVHIDPEFIQHQSINNIRFIHIQYQDKTIIIIEFNPDVEFSWFESEIAQIKQNCSQCSLLTNFQHIDLLTMDVRELNQLSKFIVNFEYNIIEHTKFASSDDMKQTI